MPHTGFFPVTRHAFERVTATHDFIWPATAALWTFRWQVKAYVDTVPNATEPDLRARFMHPLGPGRNYQNLKGRFASKTWEEQQSQLALFLLANLIGIYEAWCKAIILAATGNSAWAEAHEKSLQFPTTQASPTKGVQYALTKLVPAPSAPMTNSFHAASTKHPRYAGTKINALLACFRYFKEMRNDAAHNGSVASSRLQAAAANYAAERQPTTFPMKHPPNVTQFTTGDPVVLDLHSTVAFSEALLPAEASRMGIA